MPDTAGFSRLQAWNDTLTQVERESAAYVLGMDGGNHATAFLAVEIGRLNQRMAALERRSVWKDAVKAAGLVGTATAAFVAGWHGVPKI